MASIRVGFIGLSAVATGTSWASLAHLPYIQGSSKFTIVALCNSSKEKAHAAIEAYKLPSTTKAYGSPDQLAEDGDVDLVVCCTRVDTHAALISPSLVKGKDVYCEWPLASNAAQAQELANLAKHSGSKIFVGLQGRCSPVASKVKEIIESGKIGNVLSSTYVGAGGNFGHLPTSHTVEYMTRKEVGGNMATIHFAHTLDTLLYTLGELKTFNSLFANQRPIVSIMNKHTGQVVETVTKNTPDQMMLQARLITNSMLSFHLRGGSAFKGSPGHVWRVYGEKGEIEMGANSMISAGPDPGSYLKLYDFASDELSTVEVVDKWSNLPQVSKGIAEFYDRIYKLKQGEKVPENSIVGAEEAVRRHTLVDGLLDQL